MRNYCLVNLEIISLYTYHEFDKEYQRYSNYLSENDFLLANRKTLLIGRWPLERLLGNVNCRHQTNFEYSHPLHNLSNALSL